MPGEKLKSFDWQEQKNKEYVSLLGPFMLKAVPSQNGQYEAKAFSLYHGDCQLYWKAEMLADLETAKAMAALALVEYLTETTELARITYFPEIELEDANE